MKILIVDDDLNRSRQIEQAIKSSESSNSCTIDAVNSCDLAKRLLRNNYFDLLILDVALPKSEGSTPTLENGIKLLDEVVRRHALRKPERIIGITAHVEDLGSLQGKFHEHCFSIIEAATTNPKWMGDLVQSINYTISSKISRKWNEKGVLIITVHGIRTFGNWQEALEKVVSKHISTTVFQPYKYGYLTIVSFFIPFLRRKIVKSFESSILQAIKDNPDIPLFIFSHSFGTYLAVKAIESLLDREINVPLELIVLSGSVLKSDHDWSSIYENTSSLIINECGTKDYVLWFSEALVPGTGMGGKTGFYGLNNNRFVNRYHNGGHSLYFNEDDGFIEMYWMPLFFDNKQLVRGETRKESIISHELIEGFVKLLGVIKTPLYLAILVYLLFLLIFDSISSL